MLQTFESWVADVVEESPMERSELSLVGGLRGLEYWDRGPGRAAGFWCAKVTIPFDVGGVLYSYAELRRVLRRVDLVVGSREWEGCGDISRGVSRMT